MALRRVFVDSISDGEALARGSVAYHLARVARLRPGERIEVSDQIRAYRAVTQSCTPAEVRFRIEGPVPERARLPLLEAGLAIIRFNRFEWALEKLTELGVQSIFPVVAERSDSRLVAVASKRLARWRRIAFEAAQQSRRIAAPTVQPPTGFADLLRGGPEGKMLLAATGGRPVSRLYGGESARFLVGPEGGWTADEREMAKASGFEQASLGGTVLRAETAAVAMAAVCASVAEEDL